MDRDYMTGLNPIVQIGTMLIGILSYRVFLCVFRLLIKTFLQLTWLGRAVQGNIGPQANIFQYCPRARLVRGEYM